MKEKRLNFITRILYAIKLEEYQELAAEKFTTSIKFSAKLMLIFALIISIAITFKFNSMLNNGTLIDNLNQMQAYGIKSNITEQMVQEITSANRIYVCMAFYFASTIYTYVSYFILALMDILLLSILGFIVSKTFKINLKYEAVYNISTYSLVLSIILNMIYICVNLMADVKIEYFSIVYNVISYIYLIAAILIIKAEIIKTNIELMAIVNEQEKIKTVLHLKISSSSQSISDRM